MAHPHSIQALFEQVHRLALLLTQMQRFDGTLPNGERSILELIANHGPCSVPQLARLRTTSRQNVQIIVNRLHTDGCVELLNNPAHRRSPLFQATEKGVAALRHSAKHQTQSIGKVLSVPEAEVLAATAAVRLMRALLSGEDPQATPPQTPSPPKPTPKHKIVTRKTPIVPVSSEMANVELLPQPPTQEYELPVSLL